MSHGHPVDRNNTRRVQIALILTGSFMLVEVVGGIISGSLALLADAGHMLTDTMALALAAVAFRVSAMPADTKRTFGYQRFQIIAAFVNGISLIGIVAWIVVEAVLRLLEPSPVAGQMMLMVAAAGLAINIVVFVILHGGDQDNLNIRGAALHVLGDLLGSVAAIIAALVILQTGWMPIDPILSVVVAALILRSAWKLVRRSAHILLEGAPEWLDVAEMRDGLVAAVPAVKDIHHVHVWGLTPQYLMLTMHIVLDKMPADATAVVRDVKRRLKAQYSINHSTIEIEVGDCADDDHH